MTKLKHIGLQVLRDDVEDFYLGVLGGDLEGSFTISSDDAKLIFNIGKEMDVFFVNCGGLVFELFVNKKPLSESCTHTCFMVDNANEYAERAEKKRYPLYVRTKYEKETYFIKDKNNNLFEIKYKD